MKLFRVTTKVEGCREPFVDWFEADNEDTALAKWKVEAAACGVPLAKASTSVVECDRETLKPVS